MASFHIITPDEQDTWDDYVDKHPKGTIFHTSQMVRVYEATRHYYPFAVAAVDISGNVSALLVAVRINTVAGLATRFASRSIMYAEPLCDDDEQGIAALAELIRCHDRQMRRKTLFTEVRSIHRPAAEQVALESSGYQHMGYRNYIVDLSPGNEVLWKRLGKSCRQKIRRSEKRGVAVEEDTSPDGIRRMYDLVRISYARANVPLADKSLFDAAYEMLPPGAVQVRIACHANSPVAAGISLVFKGRIYAWYGGSMRLRGLAPFDCLTWEEIKWGCEHRQSLYDFGGAGWPNEEYGPGDFKAKFRGELVDYGRYRRVYSRWRYGIAHTTYQTVRRYLRPRLSK